MKNNKQKNESQAQKKARVWLCLVSVLLLFLFNLILICYFFYIYSYILEMSFYKFFSKIEITKASLKSFNVSLRWEKEKERERDAAVGNYSSRFSLQITGQINSFFKIKRFSLRTNKYNYIFWLFSFLFFSKWIFQFSLNFLWLLTFFSLYLFIFFSISIITLQPLLRTILLFLKSIWRRRRKITEPKIEPVSHN